MLNLLEEKLYEKKYLNGLRTGNILVPLNIKEKKRDIWSRLNRASNFDQFKIPIFNVFLKYPIWKNILPSICYHQDQSISFLTIPCVKIILMQAKRSLPAGCPKSALGEVKLNFQILFSKGHSKLKVMQRQVYDKNLQKSSITQWMHLDVTFKYFCKL